ncbi:MAG TPA: heavy metal sensor histidine kinase [Chthoniobacterales bacterium]|jgi:two-component system heavy metal sensor histidine kinase CusS|nr:heavy metal sensor histidine kinase [Chthoniobacterales bacterium]
MSSNRTEARSIATQLVLLFTLCAALLLCCGLGVFYWMVVRHAFEEDNAVLADKLAAIRTDLKQSDGLNTVDRELKNRRAGEPVVYWMRIIDPSGDVVTETPGMDRLLPPKIFAPPQTSTSLPRSTKDYHKEGKLFSLTARNETVNGQPYLLQIAQDRSADERFRKEFGALLALVLGLGLIASTLVAIIVTRRALRPLAEMKRSLERVQPAHLSERIEPTQWPRELQPVVTAFDGMLDRLEDSFTRLSQFSADLAHELRTPIGNMLGEAQVALTRERSSEEYRSIIESTAAECERLSGIIDNLLFLARAESAEQQIERSLFDGRSALEKIASFYQTVAEDRHVTITPDGEGQIFADPALFNRALSNLIDNALRFTTDGGNIRISIGSRDGRTDVSVRDTGSGIPPEHLPRVFDRFYRGDASRSSAGTGLGLALVKSIVDLHGGSARIESELGRGTTVTLTFPNKAATKTK